MAEEEYIEISDDVDDYTTELLTYRECIGHLMDGMGDAGGMQGAAIRSCKVVQAMEKCLAEIDEPLRKKYPNLDDLVKICRKQRGM